MPGYYPTRLAYQVLLILAFCLTGGVAWAQQAQHT
jgi:hypothetical protein